MEGERGVPVAYAAPRRYTKGVKAPAGGPLQITEHNKVRFYLYAPNGLSPTGEAPNTNVPPSRFGRLVGRL